MWSPDAKTARTGPAPVPFPSRHGLKQVKKVGAGRLSTLTHLMPVLSNRYRVDGVLLTPLATGLRCSPNLENVMAEGEIKILLSGWNRTFRAILVTFAFFTAAFEWRTFGAIITGSWMTRQSLYLSHGGRRTVCFLTLRPVVVHPR